MKSIQLNPDRQQSQKILRCIIEGDSGQKNPPQLSRRLIELTDRDDKSPGKACAEDTREGRGLGIITGGMHNIELMQS